MLLPSARCRVGFVLVLCACASKAPNEVPSAPAPELRPSYALESPEDFEAARADAEAAMLWLIRTDPRRVDAQYWKHARDLALDWIEGVSDPQVTVEPAILQPIESDNRYLYSPHMRMAYLSGKALYLLEHGERASAIEAELAATEAMLTLYSILATGEADIGKSRRLERLARKQRKGKLRAWLADALE